MAGAIRRIVFGSRLEGPARHVHSLIRRVSPTSSGAEQRRSAEYDRLTIAIAKRVLNRDSNAIDAGANAGVVLSQLTKLAPDGRHFAFEPLPHLAERLRRNYPAVTVHEVALSDFNGDATFRFVRDAPALSSLYVRPNREVDRSVQELTVSVRKLDELIPLGHDVAFLKIDVEGAEAPLLRGASRVLAETEPVVVFESSVARLPEIVDVFRPLQFEVNLLVDWLAGSFRDEDALLTAARQTEEFMFVASRR
jgi:FkbM family methyltransferase